MRIAIFTPVFFPIIGGVTLATEQLRKAAVTKGDSVLIVIPVGSISEESTDRDVIRLCIPDNPTVASGPVGYVRAGVLRRRARHKISGLLQEYKADVIHIQCPIPKFLGLLPPHIPILITYHGSDVLQLYGPTSRYMDKLNKQASHISAVSGGLLAELLDMRPQLSGKATRIFNGKPSIDEVNGLGMQRNGNQPYVLFAGDLNHRKAPDLVIRAFAKLPSGHAHRLYLVGDGPERRNLQELARNLSIAEKVKFLGVLSRTDTLIHIRNADLLVLSSRREGRPLVVMEAMALGCPVVASGITACATSVKDGENGYLFEPENPADLARCVWTIIHDKEHRERLSQGALQTARSYPTWDEVYQHYRSRYEEMIALRQAHGANSKEQNA